MSPSRAQVLWRAAWMTAAFAIAGIVCALTFGRLWVRYQLPDVAVVRKVDYNEYIEEAYQQVVTFGVACLAHWLLGLARAAPGSWGRVGTVIWIGTVHNFLFESALQWSGRRNMDLARFALHSPAPIVALVSTLGATSPQLGKVAASSYQALTEGGLYFGNFYLYSVWFTQAFSMPAVKTPLRVRAGAAATLIPVGASAFRTIVSYAHGWPQPIVYGSAAASRRMMLSTLGYRVPGAVGVAVALATPQARAAFLPMVAIQLPCFLYFFFMLRAMGRSYVEAAEADGSGPLPLAADIACNVFRGFEPLFGSAMVTLISLAAYGRLGAGGGGGGGGACVDKKRT